MDLIKKYLPWAVIAFIIVAVIWIFPLGGCDVIKGLFAGKVSSPPLASEVGIPEDAVPVPVIEDRYTIAERVNPFHKVTRAEELTKDLPPGTEVYDVKGAGQIYRTPDGFIYKVGDLEIDAYKKPTPFIAAELRPKIMATSDFSTVGFAVELDLVRAGKFHAGPAAGFNMDSSVWGGAGVGYNAWRNVDIGGYGGYGTNGTTYGLSVGIAIE